MAKFLDEVGLGRVWSIIKSAINQLVSDLQDVQDKVEQKLDLIQKVTHQELIDLKYNGELIPGQQYQITDYFATASADNLRTEKHRFDIIVTATSTISVSEDAKACSNDSEGYFDDCNLSAWEVKYCLDNDIDRFPWAGNRGGELTEWIEAEYAIAIDVNDESECDASHKSDDIFKWWGYNDDDILCIYKTSDSVLEYKYEIDTCDEYQYRGITQYQGGEYDVWQKYEDDSPLLPNIGISGLGNIYVLTKRIVTNNSIDTKFTEGRGVIYYMKDEHGNECPYDFKNILILRSYEWFEQNQEYIQDYVGDDMFPYWDMYFYTFSYWSIGDSARIQDLTVLKQASGHDVVVTNNKESAISYETLPNNVYIYTDLTIEDGVEVVIQFNNLNEGTYDITFFGTCAGNNLNVCGDIIFGPYALCNDMVQTCWSLLVGGPVQLNKFHVCDGLTINSAVCFGNEFFSCENIQISNSDSAINGCKLNNVCNLIIDSINLVENVIKSGDYDGNELYAETGLITYKTIALKSNGKIVVYNEADLIADQY